MNALIDSLPTRQFMGDFLRSFEQEPQVGELYVVVRVDAEDQVTAALGRLRETYPNCNTGNPTYLFDYEGLSARAERTMAREIIRGNCYYSLYRA
jgi:hypothetical protein